MRYGSRMDHIGEAEMLKDGRIGYHVRAEGPGAIGDARGVVAAEVFKAKGFRLSAPLEKPGDQCLILPS